MAKIASIFGVYADQLQLLVDNSLDKFAPLWFPKYFDYGAPQINLTYVSVLGTSRIEAAASVIARGSAAPLRGRNALQKLTGEIPPIAEKFKMDENDYRDFMTLQQLQNVDDQTKKTQLLELLFSDVKRAGDSAAKRVDYMCLQGVSTGTITIDINTNPDGTVLSAPIDLGIPTAHKINALNDWGTPATATPISDIQAVLQKAELEGKSFDKMLMSKAKWYQFMKAKEVVDVLTAFQGVVKGAIVVTLDKVNEYLSANFFPQLEIVNEMIGVEKDGIITANRPWNDANVAFIPASKLGKIHNALAIEQMQPVSNVRYATYNRALISKWQGNDPFLEFTKVELNAFPGFEMINYVFLLSTTISF